MSIHTARVTWRRNEAPFTDNRYSRAHEWEFDGGASVRASASPHVVPTPMSEPANVDPEEAFVAALSSCHMLFFLSIAAKRRYVVDEYVDEAEGRMAADDAGRLSITHVVLRPIVRFSGVTEPDAAAVEKLHHLAHANCFIANSVKTRVTVEPVALDGPREASSA